MIRPKITHEGQPYIDDPVFLEPKDSPVAESVARAFGAQLPKKLHNGYHRVQLKWMKPGPNGRLVPK